jgi:integrase
MPIFALTENFINEQLETNVAKRVEWCDATIPGLYLELRAAKPGSGIFRLRYKSNGKTSHLRIGSTEETTLKEARKQAKELKAEIALGADPKAADKEDPVAITLAEFFADHYLPFATPRKRSIKRDIQLFVRIKEAFGDKPLDEIKRQEVQVFHTNLLKSGLSPASANHHLKILKRIYSLALAWQFVEKNILSRMPMFEEDNQRENYLSQDQLKRLLDVLRTDVNRDACNIILFLLSTGGRLSEALKATWSQIHIDKANQVWRIPAQNSKSKRVRAVPLNATALSVLNQLETKDTSEYLFVNPKTGLPFRSIQKPWARIKKKAKLEGFRLHDLRHTYASYLVNSGQSLYVVQQILGHSDPKVTQRYSHLSVKTLQEAADSASKIIEDASSSKTEAA